MRKFTKSVFLVLTSTFQVSIAAAQTESPLTDRIFTCSNPSVTRTLKIQYPNGTPLPCRVVYDKSQEGSEVQILWQATTEEGYCEDKAETFVTKLTNWGWTCSEGQQ